MSETLTILSASMQLRINDDVGDNHINIIIFCGGNASNSILVSITVFSNSIITMIIS